MIRPGDGNTRKQAIQLLHRVLEEAAEAGADTIQVEYADKGLEVTFMFGPTGVGDVLINRVLEGQVIGLIVQQAHLQNSSRGTMGITLFGEPYIITVEEYESFGESAFKLKLEKHSRRQT